MTEIVRLVSLYNMYPIKARKANPKKKIKGRTARPARKGVFAVSKSKFFEDYIFHDESKPNIPGTHVPRLRLVRLGVKAKGATSDEVKRVIDGLARCSQGTEEDTSQEQFITELLRRCPQLRREVLPDGTEIIRGIRLKTPAEQEARR
jgi:hypothetical protein